MTRIKTKSFLLLALKAYPLLWCARHRCFWVECALDQCDPPRRSTARLCPELFDANKLEEGRTMSVARRYE